MSAATNAPGIEPRPPTTVTTNASAMIDEVHAEIGGLARQLQRAGEPREKRAQREHAGEERALVDAERAGQHAILGRGAHEHAEARARRASQRQRDQDERADARCSSRS